MKTPLLCLFTMMIVATVGSAPVAQAAGVLDQIYHDPPADVFGGFSRADMSGLQRAQTFTVGIAGTLDHVDVLQRAGSDPPSLVRILATSSGVPTNTVVATSNLVSLTGDGWNSFDLSGAGLTVAVSDVLAIEPAREPGSGGSWRGRNPGGYAAGSHAFRNPPGTQDWTLAGGDFFFRTFVNAPVQTESSTWGQIKADRR